MDFAVSEFKATKLFISVQSRERIQRVSMFFLGGGGFKSVDLMIKCVYLKLNWSIYFGKTADLSKNCWFIKNNIYVDLRFFDLILWLCT